MAESRQIALKLHPLLAVQVAELIATWSGVQGLFVMLMLQLMTHPGYVADKDSDYMVVYPLIGMEARTQIAILKAMLRRRIPADDIERLDKILDRMETSKKMRDFVSHCFWEPGKRPNEMYGIALKTTHKARMIRHHFTPDRLKHFSTGLVLLAVDFVTILHRHGYLRELNPSEGRVV